MRSVVLAALLALASTARADDAPSSYRAVIDRVELEPASITGQRLRIYLSALSLDGQRLDLTDPKSIRLYVGAAPKSLPLALGTFDATDADAAIVVLVQATLDFADALPTIADALDREVVTKLPAHAQIAIATFGDSVGKLALQPGKALRGTVQLASDDSAADPALLDAIDRALVVLRKARAGAPGQPDRAVRELIIVVGDGRNSAGDKDRVTALGARAAKEGVRIHAIAYSPSDTRRPLLVLGELTRRSLGTFRWPGRGRRPGADSWTDAFAQLAAELDKQYVLTYFATAEDDIAGKRVHVVTSGRTETTSNEVKVPDAPSCAGAPCDGYCAGTCVAAHADARRGAVGWLLLIAGGVAGAILILGLIGYAMSRAQARPRAVADVQAAAAVAAGLLPNGRPIPGVVILTGPRAGQRFVLRDGFLIGKQPGCDLLIEDNYTSSQHAQLSMDAAGNCVLYDRGSTNGTFVNGAPVRQVALVHGATIRVGSTELRFLAQ